MTWLVYALAAIGAASVTRWVYRHRNDGSSLPMLLKPRGWSGYAGSAYLGDIRR